MLHTEPSFSVYADEDGLLDNRKGELKVKIGSDEFSFAENMGLSVENHEDDPLNGFKNLGILQNEEQIEPVSINGAERFDESGDVVENHKRMVEEDPSNPVLLKTYAHLLQLNGDVNGAEEYYFRATMADPKDGEILMQYAKLVWELHRDQDRASGYFQSAVHAAPENSDVLAAYARFLWEIDESEENDEATAFGVGVNDLDRYYKTMVNESCCDPLLLTNYARFLQQVLTTRQKETLKEPKSTICVQYKPIQMTAKQFLNTHNWCGSFIAIKTKLMLTLNNRSTLLHPIVMFLLHMPSFFGKQI